MRSLRFPFLHRAVQRRRSLRPLAFTAFVLTGWLSTPQSEAAVIDVTGINQQLNVSAGSESDSAVNTSSPVSTLSVSADDSFFSQWASAAASQTLNQPYVQTDEFVSLDLSGSASRNSSGMSSTAGSDFYFEFELSEATEFTYAGEVSRNGTGSGYIDLHGPGGALLHGLGVSYAPTAPTYDAVWLSGILNAGVYSVTADANAPGGGWNGGSWSIELTLDATPSTVPEPSSLGLMGLSAVAFIGVRRRRGRRRQPRCDSTAVSP